MNKNKREEKIDTIIMHLLDDIEAKTKNISLYREDLLLLKIDALRKQLFITIPPGNDE